MRRKRRTVSETETHRVVTVRGRSMHAYCGGCGRQVEMFTVDRAAEALGIGVASLCERVSNARRSLRRSGRDILGVCDVVVATTLSLVAIVLSQSKVDLRRTGEIHPETVA